MTPEERRERFRQVVLAAAIGDAMGHPTEFMKLPEIYERFGPTGVQGYELYWEREGKRFAPYTDDTQMAIAVAQALLAVPPTSGNLDDVMKDMGARFIEWLHNPVDGHRAPGNACIAGVRAFSAGVPWTESGGAKAGGCGSVMRAYPFALAFDDVEEAEHWAVEHSKITHRDPIALAACAAMARGVHAGMRGASVEATLEQMCQAAARYSASTAEMMRGAIAAKDEHPDIVMTPLNTWAAHGAIAAGAYLLAKHGDDVKTIILSGANSDGDSDSIATLGAALAAARPTCQPMPPSWVSEIERSDELVAMADALARRG